MKNGPTELEPQGLPRIFMSGQKVIEICGLPVVCCYIWLSSLLCTKEYKLCNSYSTAERRREVTMSSYPLGLILGQ